MKRRLIAALLTGVALSACAAPETVTRAAPETVTRAAPMVAPQQIAPMSVSVNRITVRVPRELKVSEANRYFPDGDIVWREDPLGDRYAQVQAIVEDAMHKGVDDLKGAVPVDLDIEVVRFHALTEKARFSVGGVHALHFKMTLLDPATGRPLTETRLIRASVREYGGDKAIAAMQRGETQKVRITEHLAQVIRAEVTAPGSYRSADLGVMSLFE